MTRAAIIVAALLHLVAPVSAQDLLGHGGPVAALDIHEDKLVSGSLDSRSIIWDRQTGTADHIVRFHTGNVTAVAFLGGGGFVTGGQDGRLVIWAEGGQSPVFASPEGSSPISALDVSPDGAHVVAGTWAGDVIMLDTAALSLRAFAAHSDRITGLGFVNGRDFFTVGSDFRLMRWDIDQTPKLRVDLPNLPNGLAITQGRVAVIFAEGTVRLYAQDGALLPERFLTDRPLIAIDAADDRVATSAIDGTVWVLAAQDLSQIATFEAASGPVWSVALSDTEVFTAGGMGPIRRWSVRDGQPLGQGAAPEQMAFDDGSRGAEIWKSCAVCHSLDADDHVKAGPSLHGVLGRPIASHAGYDYSQALRRLDIVWTAETISELFEFGPEAYTPGSRMPDQRINAAEDRQALVDFLANACAAASDLSACSD